MLPVGGVVAGRGGVGCVCGVGMPLWLCLVGAAAGVSLRVGRFLARARLVLGWACCCVLPACPFACRGAARLFACRLCAAARLCVFLLRFVLLVGYCVVCVS